MFGDKKPKKAAKVLDKLKIDDSDSENSEPVVENKVIERNPVWVQRNGKTEKLKK